MNPVCLAVRVPVCLAVRLAVCLAGAFASAACGARSAQSVPTTPPQTAKVQPVQACPQHPDSAMHAFGRYLLGADEAASGARGGTTTGARVTLAAAPTAEWTALQAGKLSRFERDRRAILAMAGHYRTSFEFEEVVSFLPETPLDQPYRSWATEVILVVEDTPRRIVLQHLLAMSFVESQADGSKTVKGPFVMKHWRQDWTYEDRELWTFTGSNTWTRQQLPSAQAKGRWSQAVYQVDDAPRYEALGRWQHHATHSEWQSELTARPLPRREYSVRRDYDLLLGTNRHLITPRGWVHLQHNTKRRLGAKGKPPIDLAREWGLNRYRRLADFDAQAVATYWQRTQRYWQAVRQAWADTLEGRKRVTIHKERGGKKRFEEHFAFAEDLREKTVDEAKMVEHALQTVAAFVE